MTSRMFHMSSWPFRNHALYPTFILLCSLGKHALDSDTYGRRNHDDNTVGQRMKSKVTPSPKLKFPVRTVVGVFMLEVTLLDCMTFPVWRLLVTVYGDCALAGMASFV